jgi:hypothetical protein
VVGGTGLAGF